MNKKAKIGLIILAFIILTISTKVYATNGKANQETVRMREEASTESSVVTLISLDEEVEVLSEEGEWYKIKYKTYTGYVRKDMLDVDGKTETAQNTNSENTTSSEEIKDKIEIGYTGTIASKLDLKLVPSITSSNINTIEENSKIIIKDIINKWSYVETDNKSGWVLTSKIKVSEQKNEEVKTEENKEQTVEETKKEENTEKTNVKLSFEKPVEGDIVRDFAVDNLIYSNTLQEWTTHTGVDIKAEKTTVVKASEAGTVKSIKNDPRYGLTIVILHDNGFETVYSNLLTSEFVVEGEKVGKGQSIGTVGNTAAFEVADDSHLHFEILKDSIQVDPSIYLK